jgi:hypothetical protein
MSYYFEPFYLELHLVLSLLILCPSSSAASFPQALQPSAYKLSPFHLRTVLQIRPQRRLFCLSIEPVIRFNQNYLFHAVGVDDLITIICLLAPIPAGEKARPYALLVIEAGVVAMGEF